MAGPAPAVAAARLAVRTALADLPKDIPVLVACSGGADSLALAAATAFVAPRLGLRAGAVVVDHGLRQESAAVARAAADTCRELGLAPVTVHAVDATGPGGPEGAARTARYAAIEATAQETGAVVLLGHTLDDQAETVLLGLGRGSGPRSLAGMAARSGSWRRPFLGLRRTDTEGCCQALGLTWERDPTNALDGPWRRADGGPLRRAALRHRVLPALAQALGPGVPEALARTADRLREDEDYLAAQARDLAEQARDLAEQARDLAEHAGLRNPPATPADSSLPAATAHFPPRELTSRRDRLLPARGARGAGVALDVGVLTRAHPALRGRVLHLAGTAAGCPPGALAAVHVAALEALVIDYRGQGPVQLPGGVTAWRECGRLIIGREGRPAAGSE